MNWISRTLIAGAIAALAPSFSSHVWAQEVPAGGNQKTEELPAVADLGELQDAEVAEGFQKAFDAGRFDEALRYVDEALARWPRDPDLMLMRTVCLNRLGRHDEAVEQVDHAEAAGLEAEAGIPYERGYAAYYRQDWEQAETHLQTALDRGVNYKYDALEMLGMSKMKLGKYDEAEKIMGTLAKEHPDQETRENARFLRFQAKERQKDKERRWVPNFYAKPQFDTNITNLDEKTAGTTQSGIGLLFGGGIGYRFIHDEDWTATVSTQMDNGFYENSDFNFTEGRLALGVVRRFDDPEMTAGVQTYGLSSYRGGDWDDYRDGVGASGFAEFALATTTKLQLSAGVTFYEYTVDFADPLDLDGSEAFEKLTLTHIFSGVNIIVEPSVTFFQRVTEGSEFDTKGGDVALILSKPFFLWESDDEDVIADSPIVFWVGGGYTWSDYDGSSLFEPDTTRRDETWRAGLGVKVPVLDFGAVAVDVAMGWWHYDIDSTVSTFDVGSKDIYTFGPELRF